MSLHRFDPVNAIINPWDIHSPLPDFPDTVVSVFSHILFDRLLSVLSHRQISAYHDVDGEFPIYAVDYADHTFAFVKARLGAPACTGSFEDVLAHGGKRLILLGNCGVLDKRIADCGIIIPTAAIRDEGTSYHYAPASDTIEVNRVYREQFQAVCRRFGYPYTEGMVWTTDAFYRETPDTVAERKAMGAVCVDMECAAVQAMCDLRGVDFFQFFYAGDNLDHPQWDKRSLSGMTRLNDKEKIALLAFELAVMIEDGIRLVRL